jgi:hypothetical protein
MKLGSWPRRSSTACPCGSGLIANKAWSLAKRDWLLSCPSCVAQSVTRTVSPSRNVEEDATRHAARRAIEDRAREDKEPWE